MNEKLREALAPAINPVQQWMETLEQRERYIVIGGSIALIVMMFYLIVWEPITEKYNQQQTQHEAQRQLYNWMKNASAEINALKSAGGNSMARFRNQSISSLADRSATTTGIKPYIEKIDQSKNGVKVTIKAANFDRVITWLSDLKNKYGIFARKVKIEKSNEAGAVDASITLERPS
ncbi:hypothetical protein MNBD_GAMMA09-1359 [hydrothermal vent metagenome]|uniref:General secretion pathway protein M n=1 Tax=hydrothermal vent metagenome TaxID=652676 RepID=A0A3B0X7E9_9ZZZZ